MYFQLFCDSFMHVYLFWCWCSTSVALTFFIVASTSFSLKKLNKLLWQLAALFCYQFKYTRIQVKFKSIVNNGWCMVNNIANPQLMTFIIKILLLFRFTCLRAIWNNPLYYLFPIDRVCRSVHVSCIVDEFSVDLG